MSVSFRASHARFAWVSLALLLVAAIAGCTLKSGGYNTTSPPKVRVFNGAIDIGTVDLTLGTVLAVPLLGYEQGAPYHAASTGTQLLRFTYSGSDTVIADTTQDLENGDRFSYILYGRPTSPATILIRDNVELPGGGSYKMRFINAATEMGPLDLYITNVGQTLDATVTPSIANIALGAASDFVEPNAGTVEVRITLAGSKVAIYDSGQITLSERNAYELVAYSRGDPNLVNAELFTNDTLGSTQLLPSTLSELRLVNAVPGTPLINMVIDGTTALGNIAYPLASPYQPGIPGTHTVSIEPSSSPGTSLVSGSQTFPAGGASTAVALGPPGSVIAVALQDINFLPTVAGNARVRVVNAESGGTGVTTFVNGSLAVGALTPGQASLYFELPAATYTFGFVDATSSADLLDIPGVVLAAGHTYTLFLIGLPGQLTSLLTQDR